MLSLLVIILYHREEVVTLTNDQTKAILYLTAYILDWRIDVEAIVRSWTFVI